MAILSGKQIREAQDLQFVDVAVPEWGGEVRMRTMTAGEHAKIGTEFESIPKDRQTLYVLSLVIVDEDGQPIFAGPEGIEELARKSGDVVLRLSREASRMNRLLSEDVEAAAKN